MSTSSILSERDATRQAADFAALRRMLEVSESCFSLSFAVCNDRTLRNELIDRLREEFPELALVELPPQTTDVYQAVCEQLSPDGASTQGIIVLDLEASIPLDLEASIPSEVESYPTLRALNSSRELWERLRCPVVFWLAEYAAALIARLAPDFWRYRSHQFEFVSDRISAGEAITEPFSGFAMVDALPFEEKRFRVAELEERLRDAGSPPSSDLLPHVLTWLYELARLYRHGSEFHRAQEILDRAVAWTESEFGTDDPRTATALNNLAQLLHETNRLGEAELLLRRALAIHEKSYGLDDPHTATVLNNLAQLLQDTNRLAEAETLMRRVLAMEEKTYGADHPNVAAALNNLAMLLQDTSRLGEAEPLVRRALAIAEKSYGINHPDVAIDLNNLAQLLHATNRLSEAEPLLRRALTIAENNYGTDHPDVAMCLSSLAVLLQDRKRVAEAEPLLRRALAIDEKSYGAEHPNVAIGLNNLAQFLQHTSRLGEAEALMRRHLEIFLNFTRRTGHSHPHLKGAIRNYELLLRAMGMKAEEIKQRLDELHCAAR